MASSWSFFDLAFSWCARASPTSLRASSRSAADSGVVLPRSALAISSSACLMTTGHMYARAGGATSTTTVHATAARVALLMPRPAPPLGERARERRIDEDRVVAESARAARGLRDLPLDRSLGGVLPPRGVRQRDDAAEAGRPAPGRHPAHAREDEGAALRVREVLAAEARGPHAGQAAERVDLEAGIVRERHGTGQERGGPRLGERVPDVRALALGRQGGTGKIAEQDDLEGEARQSLHELAPLGGVQRGDDEAAAQRVKLRSPRAARAPRCSPTSCAMPRAARASRASSCSRRNGTCSAVPCTSTNSPPPVITMFMSTSAEESSA